LEAMTIERERVICVSLSEAEWKAFVERCPQPVDWLREQIRSQVGSEPAGAAATPDDARRSEPHHPTNRR
jgi:hypothetical protein